MTTISLYLYLVSSSVATAVARPWCILSGYLSTADPTPTPTTQCCRPQSAHKSHTLHYTTLHHNNHAVIIYDMRTVMIQCTNKYRINY